MANEMLFEERGWSDCYYPRTKLLAWEHPDYPGLLIDDPDGTGWRYEIFAGDPKIQVARLTAFDDAAAAMAFCERIAGLADWPKATEWIMPPPAGLDARLHEIALAVTRRA